jgi:phenylpyruvate tautomerase PptA (4-oxalocrotonate tautomerase family)
MVFQNLLYKNLNMEMRNEKRRRKLIHKTTPVLVRSVRANQTSTLVWENNANNHAWEKFRRA